jgi:hypothetical protein
VQVSPRRLPSVSSLFTDYLEDWQKVQSFYSQQFSLESIVKFARGRERRASSSRSTMRILSRQQQSFGASQAELKNFLLVPLQSLPAATRVVYRPTWPF